MSESDQKPLTRDLAPFGLRIPPDLKDRIKAAAEANNRSMNAEIVSRLEASFEKHEEGESFLVGILVNALNNPKANVTVSVVDAASAPPFRWLQSIEVQDGRFYMALGSGERDNRLRETAGRNRSEKP